MPTLIQPLYEELINILKNTIWIKIKINLNVNKILKIIRSSKSDVYNDKIDMEFLNKIEVNKQYRQSVINTENIASFCSVIQKFLRLKVITVAIV